MTRQLFAVNGNTAELRIIQWLSAVQFDDHVAIKMIAGPAEKTSDRHTRLEAKLIAFDRCKDFAAHIVVRGDQAVDVIPAQLDFSRLTCARFLFEILPAFPNTLNLLVRSTEFRDGHWRFGD